MRLLSGWIRGPWLVALLVAAMVQPETIAAGKRGGGRGARTPRSASPRRPSAAPRAQVARMSHASNNSKAHHSTNVAAHASNGKVNATGSNGTAHSLAGSVAGSSAARPTSYAYGTGLNARHYTANGYGHGYRNRSSSRGYGRSQGNARALVSRLRSVHSSLARMDHDYRGHRVNAMHSLSSAIRSLSHRSSSLTGNGNMNRMNGNNGRNLGVARNGNNGGNRQGGRMTQAQSDARMNQALRTTQGIQMQMSNTNSSRSSSGHYTARRHVARAVHEMHTALAVR